MKEQRPTQPKEWLTRLLTADEKDREFAKVLSLPDNAEFWDEWTQEQWQEWQDEYNPQPEPEPETVESVEQPTD